MLQHFVPRRVNIRGQKFLLELGEDIKLPLQLFKKNQEPDMKMNFAKIDQTTGAEVGIMCYCLLFNLNRLDKECRTLLNKRANALTRVERGERVRDVEMYLQSVDAPTNVECALPASS